MDIGALHGGVTPKPRASERAVYFIPEAPYLGDSPVTSYRWSRARSFWLADALYLKNVRLLISERRESRGPAKPFALAGPVSCPTNAEQGMTCLPANDATGQNFLPGKNEGGA